ncbi:hypothetical protein ACGY1D_13495 [Burkholderia pseudomallei]
MAVDHLANLENKLAELGVEHDLLNWKYTRLLETNEQLVDKLRHAMQERDSYVQQLTEACRKG